MLCGMLRMLAAVAVGATLLGAAVAAPKSGRVVRVERRPRTGTAAPRSCEHIEGDSWICRGVRPLPGEIISIVAQDGIAAEVRIAEVGDVPTCRVAWRVRGRVLRGDVNADPSAAVIDPSLDPRTSRLMPPGVVTRSPSGRADDDVDWAIDRNGDGKEDLVATSYVCDDAGKPDINAGGQCFDLWSSSGFEMRQAHPTVLPGCTW
jgi:hypothetical protein